MTTIWIMIAHMTFPGVPNFHFGLTPEQAAKVGRFLVSGKE